MGSMLGDIAVLQAIEKYGRDEIHRCYRKDCCIAASAIVLDVLDYFHIKGTAIYSKINIFNKAAVDFLDEFRHFPKSDDESAMKIWNERKCKFIQAGQGLVQDKGYDGHVVVEVELGRPHLIDLTLDNADRPDFDINLPPLVEWFEHEEPECSGKEIVQFEAAGCRVVYELDRERNDFKDTVDWKSIQVRKPIVSSLIFLTKHTES